MITIRLENLTINHAGRDIFTDLSWAIGDKDRIGFVGANGVGKSSLLKAIAGDITPTAGNVVIMKGVRVGYLPQDVQYAAGKTLIEEAMTPPPLLAEVEARLVKIDHQLGDPDIYGDPDKLARVLDRQAVVLEEYEKLGGAQHAGRVREILTHLGFVPQDDDLDLATLSGGQKKLIALTRLVLDAPDVLLLDEPDNHLDMDAKRRLETFLRGYDGTIILVSHDRYVLDEVVTHIAELANGKLNIYVGNYSTYANQRELERLRQQQLYIAQQKEIARIEAAIKRYDHWAKITEDEAHARKARHRRRMLERMEENGEMIDKVSDDRRMNLQLNGWRGSTKSIEAMNLAMAFGDDLLFTDLNFTLRHGERAGLIGPNGAGKSVLFKLILGEYEPLDGEIKVGPSTQIAYYSQEHQTLKGWMDRTPLELIRSVAPKREEDAVTFLMRFLFTYDQCRLPIRGFSGGERSRLQLAVIMLQRPNVLLLDEPTNNLDIQSVEVLEDNLNDFDGAVLVISHDRYFLDRTVDYLIHLEDGTLNRFDGNYTDYLERVMA